MVDIQDPLPTVEFDPQGPVGSLLEKAADAWNQAFLGEAFRFCHAAARCASDHNDRAGTALAQLHLAYAQTQSPNCHEGIRLAQRAQANFRLLGDRHNQLVTQLLLARLKRALCSFNDAKLQYQEVLALCQDLESEAKDSAQDNRVRLYQQIAEQIQQILENIEIDRGQLLEIIWVAIDDQSLGVNVLDTKEDKIYTKQMTAQEFRDRTGVSWLWEGVVAEMSDGSALKDLICAQIRQPTTSLVQAYLLSRIPELTDPEQIEDFSVKPYGLTQIGYALDLRRQSGRPLYECVEVPLQAERPRLCSEKERECLIKHAVDRERLSQAFCRWVEGDVRFTILSNVYEWPAILHSAVAAQRYRSISDDSKSEAEPVEVRFELGWEAAALEESFYRSMAIQGISIAGSEKLKQKILENLDSTKRSLKAADVRRWISEMQSRYPCTPKERQAVHRDEKVEQHFLKRVGRVWQRMEENREQHQESFIEKKAGRGGTTSKGSFRAHFLNEGDGDSIVLQFPDGSLGVVDCCNPGKTHKYLRALGRQMNLDNLRLVFVAVTHAHTDHDQVISLIDKLGGGKSVEEVWLSHWPVPRIERLIDYCTSESIKWFTLDGNEHSLARQYSGVTVEILAPGPFSDQKDMIAGMKKRAHSWVDESSLVLRFDYHDHTLLLTGDAGVQNWAYVRYAWHREDKLQAQVLKVSHHGSRYNLEAGLIHDVEPKVAIVSAARRGEGRLEALPEKKVVQTLATDGRQVYYTYNGSCIVTPCENEWHVDQLDDRDIYDLPNLPTS